MTYIETPPKLTERSFMDQVVRCAKMLGWASYHTHDSRRSAAGFPDLVLVRPSGRGRQGRVIFAELKAQRGSVAPEQHGWLTLLIEAGAEVFLWRPSDWKSIETILKQ